MDNLEIPSYAKILKDGTCRYVWRDIINNGFNPTVSSVEEYPFTNGAFYINKRIDIYVRRQDPYNMYGLYNDDDMELSPDCAERLVGDLERDHLDCVAADPVGNHKKPLSYKVRAMMGNLVFPHWSRKWAFKIHSCGSFTYNAHSREREGKNHDLVGRHPLAVEKQRQASHNDAGKKDRTGARHEILKHNDRNKQPLQESTDAVTVVEQQDEDQERGRPRNGCTGAVGKAIGSSEVGVGIKLVEINHGNQHRDIHHIVERLDHISRLEIGDHPYSRQAYPLPEHTHHRGKLHIVDQEVDNSGNDENHGEQLRETGFYSGSGEQEI